MTAIKTLITGAIASILLSACTGGQPEVSPQQREALADEMLEPDSLSSGYMPGMGIGSF